MSISRQSQGQPIAPMMRVLWQEVRDRIHLAFAEEGYADVRAEHLAVLQHPGPDGQRPSTLAARSGMSRQAINHLISHLEQGGYVERYTDPAGDRLEDLRAALTSLLAARQPGRQSGRQSGRESTR